MSVSRKSFSWGIQVPTNKDHVIYVWLDALTNYISALNYPDKNNELYKNYWPADIHMIGKDILRFHAVYWPAFLLAADLKPPKRIYGHGWILSGDEKMSKSKGNILDPIEIINDYGLDPLRYYLLKEVSFGNDGSISKEKLVNCINSDLANNYGNLCQRVLSFSEKNMDLSVPKSFKFNKEDLDILNNFSENYKNLKDNIDIQNINFYMNFIIDQLFLANKYFNDQEPWKKNDLNRLNSIIYTSLELIRKISILLYPVIPNSALKALNIFHIKEAEINIESIKNNKFLNTGMKLNKINILFDKIGNMIDSHCHLDHEPLYENINEIIQRSKNVGITKLLTICTNIDSFQNIKKIINIDPIIYGTFGIHPHEADKNLISKSEIIENSKFSDKIIGIGETGLDFFYNNSIKKKSN